ncbi:MAG: DUF4433 domain-containing protein [Elusimicrobia bacterium]|nr:DUF4433 domain-containing protein [Elusimicrobiota bacterium]
MTLIYHITHISNLPGILKADGLWCDNSRREQGFPIVGIAHQNIKDRRAKRVVPLAAGGTLADYAPFYFAPRSPMLYAIHTGAVEGYQGGQAAVLHLVSTTEAASSTDRPWCFTDGHAEMGMTEFSDDLSRLGELVNFEIMQSQYWADTPDQPDRKRRRQAEFLVHECFPWKFIHEIGVHDPETAAKVAKILSAEKHKPRITGHPEWYY